MIFSSLEFLCVFLPITYVLYLLIPSVKAKNGLLIVASLLFYAYGEPVYVFLMLISAVINYASAYGIARSRITKQDQDAEDKKKHDKLILVICIVVNLFILGFFKYTGMLIGTINSIAGTGIHIPDIALPVGISFFTFQALSYVIDVYNGKVEANKNFFQVLLYICFFPQLIAGPIVKYRDIAESIKDRKVTADNAAAGLIRFICGLSKKVLIANACGVVADNVFTADKPYVNAIVAWIGALAYMMQIYYDFSGYSDMVIGLGRMFGFVFKENFTYPYASGDIKEFWRRWHISLSTWFKEYVYIPLGGNRKGKRRTIVNKWIVFFLTGLWHGANWTFILWGLYHGALLMLEEIIPVFKKDKNTLLKVILHIYTVIAVCVGFVMFRADTVSQGLFIISRMFGGFFLNASSISFAWQQLTPYYIVMFVAAVIGCGPIRPLVMKLTGESTEDNAEDNAEQAKRINPKTVILMLCSVILLCWCMVRLSGSTYNPFIYFRF